MEYTSTSEQQRVLLEQADMILRSCEESVSEPADRADVQRRYDALVTEGVARALPTRRLMR